MNGSPTVSPTTAALWASVPFFPCSSIIFLALSHAPPAFDWKIAISTPQVVTPANKPPSISAPPIPNHFPPKPTITGTAIANNPGSTISLIDAFVEISTHLSYSATPIAASNTFLSAADAFDMSESYFLITSNAAFKAGISLNCLLTSSIMAIAALPTAFIESAEKTKGNIPPINKPAIISGCETSIDWTLAVFIKAAKSAKAVSAAEAIANPLPIAAVVFPTASNLSVLSLTSGGSSAISAIPPALSEIGPYASTANWIPVLANIPTAAIAIPYNPAKLWDTKIADAINKIGTAVDIIPTPRPAIILVADPVSDCSTIEVTGFVPVPV